MQCNEIEDQNSLLRIIGFSHGLHSSLCEIYNTTAL